MLLLAFLGGLLTIASPCILPVLALSFSRFGRVTWRDAAPMLLGLAAAFVLAASIATTSVQWLLTANAVGRYAALALLAAVGVTLWVPSVASRIAQPFVNVAARLADDANKRASVGGNFLLGAAIGLLWAPCAGPILGLLFAAGATSGAAQATQLYLAFSLGAVIMIGLVLALGSRVVGAIQRLGVADRAVRGVLGAVTLATVLALALGWDGVLFSRVALASTTSAEEALVRRLSPESRADNKLMSLSEFSATNLTPRLDVMDGTLPSFDGATTWINSKPLTPADLKGKVVLVDFWTFACYNCLNALPHVKALQAKYGDKGFIVIGVHTPELARERVVDNVRNEVKRLGIEYPVVVDNDYAIWNRFHNQYWPAAYYADATGTLRFSHFGEGKYEEQDQAVAFMLKEAAAAAKH